MKSDRMRLGRIATAALNSLLKTVVLALPISAGAHLDDCNILEWIAAEPDPNLRAAVHYSYQRVPPTIEKSALRCTRPERVLLDPTGNTTGAGNSTDETQTDTSESFNIKEWQVLIAGLLAIGSAGLGLWGVHRQIRTTWNLEQKRDDAQRKATLAAVTSELESIRYLAGKEAEALINMTQTITPSQLLESVPAESPVFHASVDKLGALKSRIGEQGALDKVLRAYALQARLAKSAQIIHATADGALEIPILKDRWPLCDLVALEEATKNALEALKQID